MMSVSESSTIHERISTLVDYFCKGNKTAFGRETDILPGVLASITGGRLSKPSFELLQKIMMRYPAVSGDWLVLGRGPMLQGEAQAAGEASEAAPQSYVTREQYQAFTTEMDERIERQVQLFEAYKHDLSEAAQLAQTYRISDANPASKHLADRLGITKDEARELVLSGQIRAKYIGKDNERARRNSVSYLITEQAVREFLGEA
jgi:hypothetical protein